MPKPTAISTSELVLLTCECDALNQKLQEL